MVFFLITSVTSLKDMVLVSEQVFVPGTMDKWHN